MNLSIIVNKIIVFLKEAQREMKKVNWITREETLKYTLIVIGISLTVAVFLSSLDYVFSSLLKLYIH